MRTSSCGRDGYLDVTLRKEGTRKAFRVHKLVALAWIGPYPPYQQVRHGPNGKLDNSVGNLCYGTVLENSRDRARDGTMFKDKSIKGVRRGDGVEFVTMADAARESNCDPSNIGACCRGVIGINRLAGTVGNLSSEASAKRQAPSAKRRSMPRPAPHSISLSASLWISYDTLICLCPIFRVS